jgi:drug/metabolite transporter (DMT)-like permease
MKASYLAMLVVGILVFLAGAVFALQGDGMINGSTMTGNPFWIYAGIGVAIFGLVIAFFAQLLNARSTPVATPQGSK